MDCWRILSKEDGRDNITLLDSCQQNHSSSVALWAVSGIMWTFTSMATFNALRIVKRSKPTQEKQEPFVLTLLMICSLSFMCLGFVKASNPSERAIGRDVAASTLFAFGTFTLYCFVAHNPVSAAGSGIILFALQRKRRLYKFYVTAFPILIFILFIGSFLPVIAAGLSDSSSLTLNIVTPITFGTYFLLTLIPISVQLYSLHLMRNEFRKALKHKRHEVSETHKKHIEIIVESTGRLDLAIGICSLFVALTTLLVACLIPEIMLVCWILFPLFFSVAWAWVTRYVIVSRRTTVKVLNRRHSRGPSLTTKQQGNSITVSATSSQLMLMQSPNSFQQRKKRFAVGGGGSGKAGTVTGSGKSGDRRKGSSSVSKQTSNDGQGKRRFLTRVDEAENEGTIVSKYDYDWTNTILSVPSSGQPTGLSPANGVRNPSFAHSSDHT